MLTNLKIQLKAEEGKKISFQMSSNLHGALMAIIPPDYAAQMHGEGRRPYSQYLQLENNCVYWNVNALNDEAYKNIIQPLMDESLSLIHI